MASKEINTVETEQQEFNESELENIMSEIESLEEEFVKESSGSSEDLAIDKDQAPLNDFQDEVDQALGEIDETINMDAEIADVKREMDSMTSRGGDQVTQEVESEAATSGPIVPTEQVIEVKHRPDTSAIFAEIPTKNKSKKSESSVAIKPSPQTSAEMVKVQSSENDTLEQVIGESMFSEEIGETEIVKVQSTAPTVKETSRSASVPVTPPDTEKSNVNNVVPFEKEKRMSTPNNKGNCDTTMNFTVSGQMTLNLNFTIGGQDIQLAIGEETGFCITMGNGVKFSVPLEQIHSIKQQKAS